MTEGGLDFKRASQLLDQEQSQSATSRLEWPTGIKSVDVAIKKFLKSGRVICIAKSLDEDLFASLSHHIIATFLTSASPQPEDSALPPAVFIITPPSVQTTLQIATLLEQRLQSLPTNTRPDATTLLSRIQLLQYLSLSGLTESIGDVSAALYDTATDSTAATATPTSGILLIQGFSATLSETLRRNGATHAAAIAANITRSLTHLSRTYAHVLVLLDLDLELQPPIAGDARGGGLLSSAFSSPQGDVMALALADRMVSAVVDAGMDMVIAVHDGFGRTREHDRKEAKKGGPNRGTTCLVEVVKDRVGGGLGEWCLWVQL